MQAIEQLKHTTTLPDPPGLDGWAGRWRAFVSTNGLRPDPLTDLKEDRTGMDWWVAWKGALLGASFASHQPISHMRIHTHTPARHCSHRASEAAAHLDRAAPGHAAAFQCTEPPST